MATKNRLREEEWRKAKKVCRLNARQVEMARALGMNPKKLPRLRPSPNERWKLPVGKFIEACYYKRFGSPFDHDRPEAVPDLFRPPSKHPNLEVLPSVGNVDAQLSELVGYLMTLAENLEGWLVNGIITPQFVAQLIHDLRTIANALETGASISPIPTIPQSPGHERHLSSRRADPEPLTDDEIPF